jgi:hypothetical protein
MSVNIPALLGLFPERPNVSASDDAKGCFTIRGACPYDAIKSFMPEALGPELIAAWSPFARKQRAAFLLYSCPWPAQRQHSSPHSLDLRIAHRQRRARPAQ